MIPITDKISALRQEFRRGSIQTGQFLNLEELYIFLDRKAQKTFNRNIGLQLYDRMNKDKEGRFTPDEFIKCFLEADEILQSKIQTATDSISEFEEQKKQILDKLNDERLQQVTNEFGLMQGAHVNVTIIDLVEFRPALLNLENQHLQLFVRVLVDQTSFRTKIKYVENLIWDEPFQFLTLTGKEEVEIRLMMQDHLQVETVLGTVKVALIALRDQNKQDKSLLLKDKFGKSGFGVINCNLQWIFSKATYLEQLSFQWDENINIQKEDIVDFKQDLYNLYEPFKSLAQKFNEIASEQFIFQKQIEFIDQKQEISLLDGTFFEDDNFLQTRFLCLILFLLMLFIQFERTMYFEFLFIITFYQQWKDKQLNQTKMWYLFLACIFMILSDLFWLYFFTGAWSDDNTPEAGFEFFVVILTLIQFFIKIILMVNIFIVQRQFVFRNKVQNNFA